MILASSSLRETPPVLISSISLSVSKMAARRSASDQEEYSSISTAGRCLSYIMERISERTSWASLSSKSLILSLVSGRIERNPLSPSTASLSSGTSSKSTFPETADASRAMRMASRISPSRQSQALSYMTSSRHSAFLWQASSLLCAWRSSHISGCSL